jgi:hypothetical protein
VVTDVITDYTGRDYASLVDSLLDLAAVRLPEWTDRSENDLGRVLLELFAYVGDTLTYYQDRIANEAFLATAVERRSVIDLLALIGYTLATPAPAAVALELTPLHPTTPIHVDPGARFATVAEPGQAPVEFAYLPDSGAAIDQVPVVAADGTIAPIGLTAINATPVASDLGVSDGGASQGFAVPQGPVLLSPDPAVPDGFVVEVRTAGVWERWERRSTLLNSLPDDPHYLVAVDAENATEVLFGNGLYGRVPPSGSPVRARYRTGGGAAGNVGPGTVTVVVPPGVGGAVRVTNRAGASGGADQESIEHARQWAPGVFRSQARAVTAEDHAALAASYPGVARVAVVGAGWNHVDLLVVATGAQAPTDALRAGLLRFFESRRMLTTMIHVRAPVFVSVDADITIGVAPTAWAIDVRQRASEAVDALFVLDRLDFGIAVNVSKFYEALEAVEGVDWVEVAGFRGRRSDPPDEPVSGFSGRVILRPREFPRRGAVTLTTSGGIA